jgi:hypothetical protein
MAITKSIKVDMDRKKEFTNDVIIQPEMRHTNIAPGLSRQNIKGI